MEPTAFTIGHFELTIPGFHRAAEASGGSFSSLVSRPFRDRAPTLNTTATFLPEYCPNRDRLRSHRALGGPGGHMRDKG
jgi:hypothetical protein